MVNNFFLSSCAKLGWGQHFFLSLFWHFFFHLRTQKMQFHLSKGFLFFKCQMKKKFKIQNIATSSNWFLLPSLTCNFSRFEKKKLVIIGDYSQNPGPLLFQLFSLPGILLAFIGIIVSGVFSEAGGLVIIHTRGMSQIWREVREDHGRNILDSCVVLTTYWNSFIV
jgi:hypothetical protein